MSQQGEGSKAREESTTRGKDDKQKLSAKPDYFTGDRNKLDAWINQMLIYFTLESVSSGQKQVLTACSFLRGECEHWVRPRLTTWLTGGKGHTMFATFATLKDELRSVYGLNNDKQQAIRTI